MLIDSLEVRPKVMNLSHTNWLVVRCVPFSFAEEYHIQGVLVVDGGSVISVISISLKDFHHRNHNNKNVIVNIAIDNIKLSMLLLLGAPEILIHDSPPPVRMSKVTGGYLSCPFISNPPPTNVLWMKGSSPVLSGEEYQIFSHNGTLFISSLESAKSELVSFTCYIANKYGSDNRTFNMFLIGQ